MGGKRTRLSPAKPAAAQRPAAPTDPLDRVELHLTRTLELVETAIAKGEATPAVVRESANVARAIVNVSAERRARTKQERAKVENLTRADFMRWLRGVDVAERRSIIRELNDEASGRSVLA